MLLKRTTKTNVNSSAINTSNAHKQVKCSQNLYNMSRIQFFYIAYNSNCKAILIFKNGVKKMTLTPEQIESRKLTIGGSDIGAILGENNYKTAYDIWEEKVEGKTIDLSRNKSVVIGNLLEDSLIRKYESENMNLCSRQDTEYHKQYKFLSANLDGIAVSNGYSKEEFFDEKNIVEIKTASCFNKDEWGESGSQIVPKQYYAQVAHYMLVTGINRADIFVGFIDDKIIGEILCELNKTFLNINYKPDFYEIVEKIETRLYTFNRDEEIEGLILEAGVSFYDNHMRPWIEHGIKNPPKMDFSNKGFQECLRKKYSIVEESEIILPDKFIEIKTNYMSAMVQSKMFDKVAQEEKSKIIEAMGNNQKALLSDGSYFLRKTVNRKAFTVKESEYIKFELKQPKDKAGDI